MGDLDLDTTLEPAGGGYRGTISGDWRLFGPGGGYVSALALRAAVLSSTHPRPASYACHYLERATEGPADVTVRSLRASRRGESLEVTMDQGGRPVLRALVWTTGDNQGVDFDAAAAPATDPPDAYAPIEDFVPTWPPFEFWRNLDYRPVLLEGQRPYVPGCAALRAWVRFRPTPRFADPSVAAARLIVLSDVFVYPAAQYANAWPTPFWATSLDLAVTIVDLGMDADWLLVDAEAPVAAGGLLGGRVSVWSESGRLLSYSVQQMLQLVT